MNNRKETVERPSEVRVSYDRTWARCLFLRAMERVAPEVVTDLRGRLLPKFRHLAPTTEEELQRVLYGVGRQDEQLAAEITPTVKAWAMEYKIFVQCGTVPEYDCSGPDLLSWMEPVLVYSFMRWALLPLTTTPAWHFQDAYSVVAHFEEPADFVINMKGWAAMRESASTFRNRARKAFEEALWEHMKARLPDDAHRPANDQEPQPRLPDHITSDHFAWLVMYQVQNRTSTKIAEQRSHDDPENPRTRQAVMEGIMKAAEYVVGPNYRAWLRKTPKGRPRRKPPTGTAYTK